jgi:hypothetical protein
MALLDDDLHLKILAYVSEPKACVTCGAWKEHLYGSLRLHQRISFNQRFAKGPIVFSYNAVRPLAEDFEESVSFNFEFREDHTYKMQWTRTFDAWSSQCEQQVGRWSITGDKIQCETAEPGRPVRDREVRFAPAGYKYGVALDDILNTQGSFFQEVVGAPPKPWEITARTGKAEGEEQVTGKWQAPQVAATPDPEFRAPLRTDARFIEIDGEMHEVSGDIVSSRPEEQWEQLMRCRLRFGING